MSDSQRHLDAMTAEAVNGFIDTRPNSEYCLRCGRPHTTTDCLRGDR